MANPLLNRLRSKDKKGLFKSSQTAVSYKTGFLPFDYRNGYAVEVRDMDENLIETYNSLGIVGGTFVTIVGKSATAKTTFAIQMASAIVRQFESGVVHHFDLEQALNYTRIKNVTGWSQQELRDKYLLKQEDNYINDIFDVIIEYATAKEECPDEFKYDSGLKDEFGDPIRLYVPTVVIIDSIPTLASKDKGKMELEGSTYANRAAKDIAQLYKRLMPIIKKYNIIVIAINHINTKIEINPMMKTQPQVMYMKMDESLPLTGHIM